MVINPDGSYRLDGADRSLMAVLLDYYREGEAMPLETAMKPGAWERIRALESVSLLTVKTLEDKRSVSLTEKGVALADDFDWVCSERALRLGNRF